MLPDLAHLAPVAAWSLAGDGEARALVDYALASPGGEPAMPTWVTLLAHHLHCVFHSAPIAAAVTALLWPWRGTTGLPLAGWWLHIAIDVFTHSATFYPVPVLYPFTDRGFDGLAWNTPWFLAANYVALALAWGGSLGRVRP